MAQDTRIFSRQYQLPALNPPRNCFLPVLISREARRGTVRTRHFLRPSMLPEILQTILLVGQKDLVDALPADHFEASYELRSQRSIHCYR